MDVLKDKTKIPLELPKHVIKVNDTNNLATNKKPEIKTVKSLVSLILSKK